MPDVFYALVADFARRIAGGASFVIAVDREFKRYCAGAGYVLAGAAGADVIVGLAGLDVNLAAGRSCGRLRIAGIRSESGVGLVVFVFVVIVVVFIGVVVFIVIGNGCGSGEELCTYGTCALSVGKRRLGGNVGSALHTLTIGNGMEPFLSRTT